MCGISLCYLPRRDQESAVIQKMIEVLTHRGPDGKGDYVDVVGASHCLAMGHNRLSIIDLTDHAAQPMKSQDGRYVLIYNGEVYNYREIVAELGPHDLPQGSDGDTAVVLAALMKWGPEALRKFNGMWALALYDSKEKTLLLSRDRFGKKPLYYYQTGDSFYVASEVKAILAATGSRFGINSRVAIPYLTRGLLDFSDETFFEGVKQFPAASYQVLQLQAPSRIGSETLRFWHHPFEEYQGAEHRDVSGEEIGDLLVDSVRLRLRSDVPVGVLLSGGLDSSSIVGAIARLKSLDNVTLLSVVSDDPASNEEPFIDSMTRFAGCSARKVNVSTDPNSLFDNLSDACWFNDAPITAISSLPHMELMKIAAAQGIKVLLTGQGAVEQLGGYNKFLYFYLLGLLKAGKYFSAIKTVTDFARHSNTFFEFKLSEAMRYVGKDRLAQNTFIAPARQLDDTVDIGYHGSYERREWIDVTKTSIPALLHSEDRMSMSQSLEMRVPFLDYRLVELLAVVRPSEKFEGGWTKSIFRKAIKGLVPEDIRYRKDKKGFTVPGDAWMKSSVSERVSREFNSDLLSERFGLVDRRKLIALYSHFKAGKGQLNGRQFFRAYALEQFLRRFESSIAA